MTMRRPAALLAVLALTVGACSSGGGGAVTTTTQPTSSSTTAPATEALRIVVTNDDGIDAPGIDALATALAALDGVEVSIVAPATNQSGTSDKSTVGGAPHRSSATRSGTAGTAVDGFPADAVNVALDELHLTPDLVVSGINRGQNLGPVAYVSGTVGAARTAARRGIPALAVSAGTGEDADYASAAKLAVAWVVEHRAALLSDTVATDTVTSINVPDCSLGGSVKAILEVPLATGVAEGVDPYHSDCAAEPPAPPTDDVTALVAGHAAETLVPVEQP
ncbi:MAG: 5'/3'-nucleotidase SurE [Microthrixaceae bacterium]